MSIVIKNSQLNDETIKSLNTLIDQDINATVAFKLMKIIKELTSILDDKSKLEKKILNKWVKKDKDGNAVPGKNDKGEEIEGSVEIKNPEKYTKEIKELYDIENEISYDKINFEDLGLKTAKVKNLIKLDFLFE